MRIDEARQLLQQALTRVPSLTPDGGIRLPRSSTQWSDREQLQIAACAEWLTAFATTRKTINDHWTSYGLKHLVEDATQAHDIDHYVCNGAFIAAAVAFGYRFAHVELNMRFAMRLDRLAAPRIRTGREQLCTTCRHEAQERHRLGRALGMTL